MALFSSHRAGPIHAPMIFPRRASRARVAICRAGLRPYSWGRMVRAMLRCTNSSPSRSGRRRDSTTYIRRLLIVADADHEFDPTTYAVRCDGQCGCDGRITAVVTGIIARQRPEAPVGTAGRRSASARRDLRQYPGPTRPDRRAVPKWRATGRVRSPVHDASSSRRAAPSSRPTGASGLWRRLSRDHGVIRRHTRIGRRTHRVGGRSNS